MLLTGDFNAETMRIACGLFSYEINRFHTTYNAN
jgi:hypothetical protein